METKADPALDAAARALLDAAMAYWHEYNRTTGGTAVVWVKDTDGRMVILTRGEYRSQLMENIDRLRLDSVRSFGCNSSGPEK
jgi:hypothetical protein